MANATQARSTGSRAVSSCTKAAYLRGRPYRNSWINLASSMSTEVRALGAALREPRTAER